MCTKIVREVILLDGANWNELNWLATWSERHTTGFLLFFCRVVNSFWIDRKLVVLGRFKSWKEDFNKFKLMLELMNCWMGLRADGPMVWAKSPSPWAKSQKLGFRLRFSVHVSAFTTVAQHSSAFIVSGAWRHHSNVPHKSRLKKTPARQERKKRNSKFLLSFACLSFAVPWARLSKN